MKTMHVSSHLNREALQPQQAQPPLAKKSGPSRLLNAANESVAQPTVKGLYAQLFPKPEAPTDSTEDESQGGASSSTASGGDTDSTVSDVVPDASAGPVMGGVTSGVPTTYTAKGLFATPPPVSGEVFETTV